MVLDTSMELKPWFVGNPLDRRVLDKVEDTFEGHPSSVQLANSQLDKMEAYRAVGTLKAWKPWSWGNPSGNLELDKVVDTSASFFEVKSKILVFVDTR